MHVFKLKFGCTRVLARLYINRAELTLFVHVLLLYYLWFVERGRLQANVIVLWTPFTSLVPRLHSPAFLATRCEKSWGVEPGNEATPLQRHPKDALL